MVIGPVDYERYLSSYYGDWKNPPSMEYRNIHNVKEIEDE